MIKLCGMINNEFNVDLFHYINIDSDLTDRKSRIQDLADLGEALDVYNTIKSLDDVAYSLGYLFVECSGDWERQIETVRDSFVVDGIYNFNNICYTFEEAYALYFLRLWCINTNQKCPYTLEFLVVPFLEFMPDIYNIDVNIVDDILILSQGHTKISFSLNYYNLNFVNKIKLLVMKNEILGNIVRYNYFGYIYFFDCKSDLVLSDSTLSYRIVGDNF